MIDEYLDVARELEKQCNIKITVVIIVVGDFGTVPKDLEKVTIGIGDQKQNLDNANHHC